MLDELAGWIRWCCVVAVTWHIMGWFESRKKRDSQSLERHKGIRRMGMLLDADDERAINEAITEFQSTSHKAFGETMLPDGASDTRGAILAEICRGWSEYRAIYRAEHENDGK